MGVCASGQRCASGICVAQRNGCPDMPPPCSPVSRVRVARCTRAHKGVRMLVPALDLDPDPPALLSSAGPWGCCGASMGATGAAGAVAVGVLGAPARHVHAHVGLYACTYTCPVCRCLTQPHAHAGPEKPFLSGAAPPGHEAASAGVWPRGRWRPTTNALSVSSRPRGFLAPRGPSTGSRERLVGLNAAGAGVGA